MEGNSVPKDSEERFQKSIMDTYMKNQVQQSQQNQQGNLQKKVLPKTQNASSKNSQRSNPASQNSQYNQSQKSTTPFEQLDSFDMYYEPLRMSRQNSENNTKAKQPIQQKEIEIGELSFSQPGKIQQLQKSEDEIFQTQQESKNLSTTEDVAEKVKEQKQEDQIKLQNKDKKDQSKDNRFFKNKSENQKDNKEGEMVERKKYQAVKDRYLKGQVELKELKKQLKKQSESSQNQQDQSIQKYKDNCSKLQKQYDDLLIQYNNQKKQIDFKVQEAKIYQDDTLKLAKALLKYDHVIQQQRSVQNNLQRNIMDSQQVIRSLQTQTDHYTLRENGTNLNNNGQNRNRILKVFKKQNGKKGNRNDTDDDTDSDENKQAIQNKQDQILHIDFQKGSILDIQLDRVLTPRTMNNYYQSNSSAGYQLKDLRRIQNQGFSDQLRSSQNGRTSTEAQQQLQSSAKEFATKQLPLQSIENTSKEQDQVNNSIGGTQKRSSQQSEKETEKETEVAKQSKTSSTDLTQNKNSQGDLLAKSNPTSRQLSPNPTPASQIPQPPSINPLNPNASQQLFQQQLTQQPANQQSSNQVQQSSNGSVQGTPAKGQKPPTNNRSNSYIDPTGKYHDIKYVQRQKEQSQSQQQGTDNLQNFVRLSQQNLQQAQLQQAQMQQPQFNQSQQQAQFQQPHIIPQSPGQYAQQVQQQQQQQQQPQQSNFGQSYPRQQDPYRLSDQVRSSSSLQKSQIPNKKGFLSPRQSNSGNLFKGFGGQGGRLFRSSNDLQYSPHPQNVPQYPQRANGTLHDSFSRLGMRQQASRQSAHYDTNNQSMNYQPNMYHPQSLNMQMQQVQQQRVPSVNQIYYNR